MLEKAIYPYIHPKKARQFRGTSKLSHLQFSVRMLSNRLQRYCFLLIYTSLGTKKFIFSLFGMYIKFPQRVRFLGPKVRQFRRSYKLSRLIRQQEGITT